MQGSLSRKLLHCNQRHSRVLMFMNGSQDITQAREAPLCAAGLLDKSADLTRQVENLDGLDKLVTRHAAAQLIAGPPLVAHGSGWDGSGLWRHAGNLYELEQTFVF